MNKVYSIVMAAGAAAVLFAFGYWWGTREPQRMSAVAEQSGQKGESKRRNPVTFKWNNPEIWRMVDAQNKIMDRQKRSVLIREIERKLLQEGVHVPLLTMDRFWVFQPWVHPKEVYCNVYQNYTFEETWMADK